MAGGAELASLVRAALDAADRDGERALAQQLYMRSALPFRGLAVPVVRSTVRQVVLRHPPQSAEEWRGAVLTLWDEAAFREDCYAALGVARAVPGFARDRGSLDLYRHLVLTGAWWDLVDETAAHLVGAVLRTHPGPVAPTLRAWSREDSRWLRRAAILAQLRSRSTTDRTLLLDVIEPNLADGEFFVRKAIGWALRQYSRSGEDAATWVRETVHAYGERLSPLSRREALR